MTSNPPFSPSVVGLVLAGGRSSRFGAEKAAALFDGRPLLDWSLATLAPACTALAVNAPAGSAAAGLARDRGLDLVIDAAGLPDGPLSGVAAGLAWARERGAEWLLTTPCDMPRLPVDLATRLVATINAGAPGASAEGPDGRQPLCALWSIALLAPLTLALRSGHPPVRAFQDGADMTRVRFTEADAFININRPDDPA